MALGSLLSHGFLRLFPCQKLQEKKDLLDDAYVGGILHDMGKIVFAHVHPKLLDRISNFCTEREIDRDLFEDLSAGLNHAEIGGRIAEKWNFPATLVEAIRFHHEPSECDPEYRDVVETVYLANALANLENGEITFEQIDPKVLAGFHIRSEEQGNAILQRLSDAFSKDTDNRE